MIEFGDTRLPERFWSKVESGRSGDCWIWSGALQRAGYGSFWWDGKIRLAHRVAYEELVRPVPSHLQCDHLCRNRDCVNPGHIEPVTRQENVRRGKRGRLHEPKSHCPQGHELVDENVAIYDGRRICKQCRRERALAYYHARSRDNTPAVEEAA